MFLLLCIKYYLKYILQVFIICFVYVMQVQCICIRYEAIIPMLKTLYVKMLAS